MSQLNYFVAEIGLVVIREHIATLAILLSASFLPHYLRLID